MPSDKQEAKPMSMGDICQRCFLRLVQHPDHICVRHKGSKKCQHCQAVRHACIPIPEEFVQEAEDAVKGPAIKLSMRVRAVRSKIIKRTRNIKKDKKTQQFLDHLLAEALTPSESLPSEVCEVCDDACLNAAAEQQLLESLAEAANCPKDEEVKGDIMVQLDGEWESSTLCDGELEGEETVKVEQV